MHTCIMYILYTYTLICSIHILYSSTCVYYAISGPPPVTEPVLVLNGESDLTPPSNLMTGNIIDHTPPVVVNNVCFPSTVCVCICVYVLVIFIVCCSYLTMLLLYL